jgi:predicted permease
MQGLLVIAEVSLSLILLFGACLTIRTFRHLEQADRGVQWKDVLGTSVPFLPQKYPTPQSRESLARDILRRIEALPGVESGAVSSFSLRRPFTLDAFSSIGVDKEIRADLWVVSSRFFQTMRIPLLAGRGFNESDTVAAPQIAAVNRTMARRFWPNSSPLGKQLFFRNSSLTGEAPIGLTIVAVVDDVRWMRTPVRPFDIEAQPTVYRPFLQSRADLGFLRVRARIDWKALVDPIRRQIRAVDPDIPLSITTPEHALDEEMARPGFNAILVLIFAIVALLLCTVGTFGVVAYSATLRTHEIGIRLALGAQKADILKSIVVWGIKLAFGGIAAGVLGSLALGRFAESQLYGVTGGDPASLAAASLGLVAVTLLASCLPARIATRTDPIVALRLD